MKGANEVENVDKLITEHQKVLNRQIGAALDHGEMDEVTGRLFFSRTCTAETTEGVYDHFDALFKELAAYHEQRLQQRVIKGAEVLDSMDKQDERYAPYMRLYDSLDKRLQRSQSRHTG